MKELFQRAKAQFKGGAYDESLATLSRLDAASRASDLAGERERLAPALAFYRGACLAALGQKPEAEREFAVYLAAVPAARLDPSMYPRAVLDAFGEARTAVRGPPPPDALGRGLPEAYERFRLAASAAPAGADERWANGPIRFLLTPDEKIEWQALPDAAARAEFVTLFWQRRNPAPESPRNEYRDEVERRIAFADANLGRGEVRGSETDRGMVFVLMGPPDSVAVTPLTGEEDPIEAGKAARPASRIAAAGASRQAAPVPGSRETWHYRRDRLPAAVRFNEATFVFLTMPGYGVEVLQRDPDALEALDMAAGAGDAKR